MFFYGAYVENLSKMKPRYTSLWRGLSVICLFMIDVMNWVWTSLALMLAQHHRLLIMVL